MIVKMIEYRDKTCRDRERERGGGGGEQAQILLVAQRENYETAKKKGMGRQACMSE